MPEPTGRMLRLKLALRATGSDLARAVRACHDTTGQETTRGTCSRDRLALQRARRPIVVRSCQVVARAFALIWSNSAWVIVPASRSCLADAI